MSFRMRELYYYSVCFVTLIICIFALTGLVNSIIDLSVPYPYYIPSKIDSLRMYEKELQDKVDLATIEKWIEEEQQAQIDREQDSQRYRMFKDLGRSITLLIVALPLYIYHWRRVRKFE